VFYFINPWYAKIILPLMRENKFANGFNIGLMHPLIYLFCGPAKVWSWTLRSLAKTDFSTVVFQEKFYLPGLLSLRTESTDPEGVTSYR
jgi:hypothetical protein